MDRSIHATTSLWPPTSASCRHRNASQGHPFSCAYTSTQQGALCFFDQHPASVCLGACAKKGGPWAARKDATRCLGDVRAMKPPGGRTRYPSPSAAATRECGAWHSARTRDEPPRYSREGSFFPARCVFLAFTDLRRLNRYGAPKGKEGRL